MLAPLYYTDGQSMDEPGSRIMPSNPAARVTIRDFSIQFWKVKVTIGTFAISERAFLTAVLILSAVVISLAAATVAVFIAVHR